MPLISVVIPAKNAEITLAESLESLANQTFRDFEVVLIDDGSSDSTFEIATSFNKRINIRILRHEESKGVAQSINAGICATDSEFIARLDADDLAQPLRLEKQLQLLQALPHIGVCGSHMIVFTADEHERYVLAHPTANNAIRTALLQRCAISHPSVMIRRTVFDLIGLYDVRFDFAEDYELWCRASLLGIQFANLAEPLTCYRKHQGQVSRQKSQLQFERDMVIKNRYMSAFLNGEDPGLLPQFLALQTQYPNRSVAIAALNHCGPTMTRLARYVPDADEYAQIVTRSLIRHLNN